MELGIKLLHIDEIKGDVVKEYNGLRRELKREGVIYKIKREKSIIFAEQMLRDANDHYFEIKSQVEKLSKTKMSAQIKRVMKSIRNYKDKIYHICEHEDK